MDQTNRFMDTELYKAAMEGNIEVLRQCEDELCYERTPRNNTVLHVAAQFQNKRECVQEILNLQPSLLLGVNSKGETALHIAARRGCSVIVKELLAFAKNRADPESSVAVTMELLRMATYEKDTALHEAVRNNHLDVVALLLEEDPDLSYAAANSAGETPLYLAAKRGAAERHHHDIVSTILGETCRNQAYGGPNGRSALHAAVVANCSSCVKRLLNKDQGLIKIRDSRGWTPLHFAAYFNHAELTGQLLDMDKSIAYLVTTKDDDNMTALHVAAKNGEHSTMEQFWLRCPDCYEMVNEKGQNILHIAVNNKNDGVIINASNERIHNLLNEKDNEGNTPLHLFGTSDPDMLEAILSKDSYFKEMFLKELDKAMEVPEEVEHHLKESKEKAVEKPPKVLDTIIIVAILVATVTFAAIFTIPGGFDSNQGPNQGMAILVRKAAFKAFVISNTIAVTFSISALILFLVHSHRQTQWHVWRSNVSNRFTWGWNFLIVSLVAMMVSLITGSFAVLANSMGLAVSVCAIGCLGFLIFFVSFPEMCFDFMLAKLHFTTAGRQRVLEEIKGA